MNDLERQAFLANRLAQFVGLMTHDGANDPVDRRELCFSLLMDVFIGLGFVSNATEFKVINREGYDNFSNEFTSGIRDVLRQFGVPEDDIPQWNGMDGIDYS